MAKANESSCAIEAHAQIASAQELRQVAQVTFGLGISPALDEQVGAQAMSSASRQTDEGPAVASHEPEAVPALPNYKVFFYDREYGDLTDAVTTESFDAGVQLVRDRLPVQADYVVEATWTRGVGEMEVRSPRGTVVARVEPVADTDVAVQPPVMKACTALQVGDAAPLEQLFAPLPEAA
jgi:hypothetical protein